MKQFTLLFVWLFLNLSSSFAQTTKTVGTGGNYTTLKLAFDAINAGTITGAISLQVISNTTETTVASLSASGTGSANYSSVIIYPTTTGLTINLAASGIRLDGADNITLDGRLYSSGGVLSGSTADLTLINIDAGSAAILLRNSAENNTIKYCTVKGNATGYGIIELYTSTSGNGNSGNTISNCNITSSTSRGIWGIHSGGGSVVNKNNSILNCNFYDLLSPALSTSDIYLSANSTGYTISGNSFYETSTIVPTANNSYNIIYTSSATEHLISGNYIGGSAATCGGSAMIINSNLPHSFAGIYTNGGSTTPVTIQNNIIRNINYTSTNSNPWDGIYLANGANKVTITGNTIGATTGTGSIVINTPNAAATATITGGVVTAINIVGGGTGFTTAPTISFSGTNTTVATATSIISGGVVTGYNITNGGTGYATAPSVYFNGALYSTSHGIRHLNTGTVTISNNNIGSIQVFGTDTYSHCLEAIVISGAAPTIDITNNLIGSLSTTNSLQAASAAASSLIKEDVRGIYINSNVAVATITGNTIANLNDAYTGGYTSKLDGICITGGSNIIQNNIIRNLSTASSNIIVKGIQQTLSIGTPQTTTGNTIYNLSNTNTTANVRVMGIDFSSAFTGTNTVSGNFVHSLSIVSSNVASEIDGIALGNEVATCANNIINISSGVSLGYKIYGIYDNSSASVSNNNNVYFNTVYVGGSVSSGLTNSTAAIWNSNNTSIRNYRNNILVNARSGGTTGKHYAIRLAGTSGLTTDNNDYYVTGINTLGNISGSDKTTLALWQTATGQDANSLNTDPGFTVAGSTTASDYTTSATLTAVAGTGITTDYSGVARATPPRMGAIELNGGVTYVWSGTTSSAFNVTSNWFGGVVPPSGADIVFQASPANPCTLDQNRTLGSITNTSSKDLVVNGFQLTITGTTNFSSTGKIDGTASASTVVYAGTAAQSFVSGLFSTNTVYNLILNNSYGLTQNGDLTVSNALTLTSGALSIGANTLTLNGAISYASGSLTGGASSNMIFGGSGASTNLAAITLNNLTLNRSNGISLSGNTTISGSLTLTAGTLNVAAYTLTIAGSSVTRTAGDLNVSNASGTIVFSNVSALTLPASIFNANVNNMTITGTGGVTASGNFSINGILNLNNGSTTAPNASSTKGLLDMGANTLTMSAPATNTGAGDVTGIIKRTSFVANTVFTMGHPNTNIALTGTGTGMPGWITFNTMIGALRSGAEAETSPINPKDPVLRNIEITVDPTTPVGAYTYNTTINLHYLDSELNGNAEVDLITGDYDILGGSSIGNPIHDEHGRASYDNNSAGYKYVGLAGVYLAYTMMDPTANPNTYTGPHRYRTIFELYTKSNSSYKTWLGTSVSDATHQNWNDVNNWLPAGSLPTSSSRVIIPDLNSLTNTVSPILPSGDFSFQSLHIGNGISLTALGDITITATDQFGGGAWEDINYGFIPNGHTVTFTGTSATISGYTQFSNLVVDNGATITNMANNYMKINGAVTKNGSGIWYADLFDATIEYNKSGDQTITLSASTPNYHTLVLSGSGIKTPDGALALHGSLIIGVGTSFNTGSFNHSLAGNLTNDGTLTTVSGKSLTFNGTVTQHIDGSSTSNFTNLIINNAAGVNINVNTNISEALTLSAGTVNVGGVTLGLNGSISQTSGNIAVSSVSNLSFGMGGSYTLPNAFFSSTPSLNNLTLAGTNITLGQNMTINGTLALGTSTFTVGAHTLTLAGAAPTLSSGVIVASNASASIIFDNAAAITLPAGIFSGNLNNLSITGTGGVTASSDFTINGILNMSNANPSSTKGLLDMGVYTLTMGSSATNTGTGDITGTITRNSPVANTLYTFGHPATTLALTGTGTAPAYITMKINIGTVSTWEDPVPSPAPIRRYYEILMPSTAAGLYASVNFHYLDGELNGNTESNLVTGDYDIPFPGGCIGSSTTHDEHGRAAYDITSSGLKYIGMTNIPIDYFMYEASSSPAAPLHCWRTIFSLYTHSNAAYKTWTGLGLSTNWSNGANWDPAGAPDESSRIIIPDASTLSWLPILPSGDLTLASISIGNGITLTALGNITITATGVMGGGAWNDVAGGFDPNGYNVKFTGLGATISGITQFYNLEVATGASIINDEGNVMRIGNTLTKTGNWVTDLYNSTIEYNKEGAQTVLIPDGSTPYRNLILNGSGIKTMPASVLNIPGDLTVANAAIVTAANDITVHGNLNLMGANLGIGGKTLTLYGGVTGTGKLIGSATSSLNLLGITGTVSMDQTDSASRSLNNLSLETGSSATLGNAMQIYGVLTLTTATMHVNNQGLVLKSTEAGTARVANLSGSTLDGADNVTVERYLADLDNLGTAKRAWHLLSAQSVTGSQTIKQSWQENAGTIVSGQGVWITSNLYNGSNGFDAMSASASILPYKTNGTWDYTLASTNTKTLSSEQGYMVYGFGDRNDHMSPVTVHPTVIRATGQLNTGTPVAVTVPASANIWTLVGNPYASPLDVDGILMTENMDRQMYVWDPTLAGNYGLGGYRLVERNSNGTYQQTPVVAGGTLADANSRYIHSGQAFFVKASTNPASVSITETMKASGLSVVNPIVNGLTDQQLFTNLEIVNPDNSTSLADGIRVRFDDTYSASTSDDILKISNTSESIASYRDGKRIIVERRPMINANDTVFLKITSPGIKNYRLIIGSIDFNQPGITAFLQDNYLGTVTPIVLDGSYNNFDFTVTAIAASASPDRFRILFGAPSSPLPISFTSIKAYEQGMIVAVEWKVAAELNVKQYEVERSTNGINFTNVGTQLATANNGTDMSYNWLDANPASGNNFYRIRSIENSGLVKYSSIAKVNIGKLIPAITVYPNPITGKMVNLQFTAMDKGSYNIRFINALAQVIYSSQYIHTGGSATMGFNIGNVAGGYYLMEIIGPDNSKQTIRVQVMN